jgi:hypothetical protein
VVKEAIQQFERLIAFAERELIPGDLKWMSVSRGAEKANRKIEWLECDVAAMERGARSTLRK